VRDEERLLGDTAVALKVAPQDLPERVQGLVSERRRLEQEISKLRQQLATGAAAAPSEARDVAGIRYLAREVEGVPARDLRGMADAMLRALGSGVAAVVSVVEGKATLVVSVSDDLKEAVNAVDLVRIGVAEVGGKGGGGRADFAQGGGPDGTRADTALKAIADALQERQVAAE
jgi:alanyl-tRNA synthetase